MTQICTSLPCKDEVECGSSDAMTEYHDKWKCFSCGKVWWKESKRIKLSSNDKKNVYKFDYIMDISHNSYDIPPEYLKWILDAKLTQIDLNFVGAGYSKSYNGIVFPYIKWNKDLHEDEIVGYYIRQLNPKRHIILGEKTLFYTYQLYTNKILILVEDYLSAIKVANSSGLWKSDVAGIGTNRIGNFIDEIIKYKEIVLWYDPDKAGKEGMLNDEKLLRNYVKVHKIYSDKDPKFHSLLEINNYLENCLNEK